MRKVLTVTVAFAMFAAMLCLTACFGLPQQKQAAAVVNGEVIAEDDVTEYIEGFRFKNDAYSTNEGWAQFLSSAGFTAGSFRSHILDTVFIPNTLVRQECAALGIAITDDQLDAVIEQEKKYYEQRYGSDSWDSILSSFGYDEETWRDNEELRLLEEQLKDTVIKDKTPDKSYVLDWVQKNGTTYNGKHSYYVVFSSEQDALDACKARSVPIGRKTSLKKFKKIGKAVNAGWNSLSADTDSLSNDYLNALNNIGAGQVSTPVAIESSFYVIFCDQIFECPSQPTFAQLDAFPKKIRAQADSDAAKAYIEEEYMAWLDQKTKTSEITVSSMPDGLPYNTNTKLSESGN